MLLDEISEFADRHGLGTEAVSELLLLVRRACSDSLQPGSGATLSSAPTYGSITAETKLPSRLLPPGRLRSYEDQGLLGSGATGVVRRVRDPSLNRSMAMKVMRSEIMDNPQAVNRFVEEAQTTAQLQHPGILPIFEIGSDPQGQVYFTMQEVTGGTLKDVIADLHTVAEPGRWRATSRGWTFRRVIAAFRQACDAVAYAHSRGVIHRDLKPANIMVGRHGEVIVLDWGLAKVLGVSLLESSETPVIADRHSRATRDGTIAGTPIYMSLEQASGRIQEIDQRSDVYSLGAILYEILNGGPPYNAPTGREVIDMIVKGPPPPIPVREFAAVAFNRSRIDDVGINAGPIPADLAKVCNRAMARERDDRYPNAQELSVEVAAWLEGVAQRDRALEIVEDALSRGPRAEELRSESLEIKAEAEAAMQEVPVWAPEAQKAAGWALEAEAEQLDRRAKQEEIEAELLLHGALAHAPDLPEAHIALAQRYRHEHATAEAARNLDEAARAENRLRVHVASLPENLPERIELDSYLIGDGALTLITEPSSALVDLYRYEERHRRFAPVFERTLGATPLKRVALPMGAYLLVVRARGCDEVRLPVHVARKEHVDFRRPGARQAASLRLPEKNAIARAEVYVPAGWFHSGGDTGAANSAPAERVWLEGFVIDRYPVTNRQYLEFLNALVRNGDEELALRAAPRERAASGETLGALIYGRTDDRWFCLQADGDGDMWNLDWPVVQLDWDSAAEFGRWRAESTGLPWRLPHELEWEKAARGTDGRYHPWGDFADPSWCCMRESHSAAPLLQCVDTYPIDESPYGMRGAAGNVSDWCANTWDADGPRTENGGLPATVDDATQDSFRVDKGGGWYDASQWIRCAVRRGLPRNTRRSDIGFRLARSFG
ncbi:MAG: serine/threonine-protein kinase [Bradymonadia bacterium]